MSIDRKRTEVVYGIVRELVDGGRSSFRPGDVCTVLRERNQPIGAWLVRGEFHVLETQGQIELMPESGAWRLTADAACDAGPRRLAQTG